MRIMITALGLAAGASLLSAAPAQAHARTGVEFSYGAPVLSDEGDHITWKWSMINRDATPIKTVVMTHKMNPWLPVTAVSDRCSVVAKTVRCTWGRLAPGQSVNGTIDVDLPDELTGSMRISGRITWLSSTPAAARLAAATVAEGRGH